MALGDEGATLAWSLAVYRRSLLPAVFAERRRWTVAAAAVPQPTLRRHALSALEDKAGNVEAVAVFALLAPRSRRMAALRGIAALQIAIDYLDTIEEAGVDLLEDEGDGGYMNGLEDHRRRVAASLPSYPTVSPFVERAVARCKEGQRQTHAAASDPTALRKWARGLAVPADYRWWETAAGASSSVAAHALIAAAADAQTTAAEAEAIDAAYFPPVGALTVLLDDLADRDEDRAAGEHNYIAYYDDATEAGERIGRLADQGRDAIRALRGRRRHAAILAGVAAFYLSAPAARTDYAAPIRDRLLDAVGGTGRMALAAVRLQSRE
jgi:tetraprenyl-beta-curcumene synthase